MSDPNPATVEAIDLAPWEQKLDLDRVCQPPGDWVVDFDLAIDCATEAFAAGVAAATEEERERCRAEVLSWLADFPDRGPDDLLAALADLGEGQ